MLEDQLGVGDAVFGGVPWNYIVSSVCITLNTAIFFGTVSLFFSVFCRRVYVVIILSTLTLFMIFFLGPFFAELFVDAFDLGGTSEEVIDAIVMFPSPYYALFHNTATMYDPAWTPSVN